MNPVSCKTNGGRRRCRRAVEVEVEVKVEGGYAWRKIDFCLYALGNVVFNQFNTSCAFPPCMYCIYCYCGGGRRRMGDGGLDRGGVTLQKIPRCAPFRGLVQGPQQATQGNPRARAKSEERESLRRISFHLSHPTGGYGYLIPDTCFCCSTVSIYRVATYYEECRVEYT